MHFSYAIDAIIKVAPEAISRLSEMLSSGGKIVAIRLERCSGSLLRTLPEGF